MLHNNINEIVDSHFAKYQTTHKEISFFWGISSLNHFEMLKVQIKSKYSGISEADLMIKCMNFFKDQFQSSFQSKDDSSINSAKDSDDNDYVIAGEGHDQEKLILKTLIFKKNI